MARRFSERIGAASPREAIQVDGMSAELRNSIWNQLIFQYDNDGDSWWRVAKHIAQRVLKLPTDDVPDYDVAAKFWLREVFYGLEWFRVYDVIEEVLTNDALIVPRPIFSKEELEALYNEVFREELSGFRFISGTLVPISNKTETEGIEKAIEEASVAGLTGASSHLQSALGLLGKRPKPDYRNSIKESISAVESVSRSLASSGSVGLAGALKALQQSAGVHGALSAGFNSLYGYTSDSSGIRHAILDEPDVGFIEAKYMLVSCSAFVHYLVEKAHSAGLLDGDK